MANFLQGVGQIFMIVAVFALLILPIYLLYSHLRNTKADGWVWFGFILLLLKSCSSLSSTSDNRNKQSKVVMVKSGWNGSLHEDSNNINIVFDSLEVKSFNYHKTRWNISPFKTVRENDGILNSKYSPFSKKIEFDYTFEIEKDYILARQYEYIKFLGSCNPANGECEVEIDDKKYKFKAMRVYNNAVTLNNP